MVTRKLIRITSPEAAALAAKDSSISPSAAAEDSITVNKQPPTLLTNGNKNETGGGKKRDLPSEDALFSGEETTNKRRRTDGFVIDLTDVPPQLPIRRIKEVGSSKYIGVSFDKRSNKWKAQITIDGKVRLISYYENEEEAAIDFARAAFKYKGQEALNNLREQTSSGLAVHLRDVPPQLPILKSEGNIKGGTSKYVGVNFDKKRKIWKAIISIKGKLRHIGYYKNEEEAAIDFARAVFKFKGQDAVDKAREQNKQSTPAIDLSDVPPQQPILKSKGRIKEGSSKYTGVSFDKSMQKWSAKITIEGKLHHVGYYKNEEEAAIDYARAIFKYKGQDAPDKAREQNSSGSKSAFNIDLSDVPPQPPILKSKERIKEGSSKYTGVYFDKSMSKWKAAIRIEGKQQCIGYYEDEEEAAADYARALFMFKGQDALNKARERKSPAISIDLSDIPAPAIDLNDVPPQPLLLKSTTEGSSKYLGVSFEKSVNKQATTLLTNGKDNKNGGGEKRVLPTEDTISREETTSKRQKAEKFVIDLRDVPPQLPIMKSEGNIKEGSSKYAGVTFDKPRNKWKAVISIDGKLRHIGCYENEEEAANDYARAVFKYRGQQALDKARERKSPAISIHLSDVPPQPLIRKSKWFGGSKYTCVSFNKASNKWMAQITIEGKRHFIGYYENEEEAAADYARAVFKYKGQDALDEAREQNSDKEAQKRRRDEWFVIDLAAVPQQPLILKSGGRQKDGASKYTGVSFHKPSNKWQAQIKIEGKSRHIGYYENEEDAAIDYARAFFKYKGQDALDKARKQNTSSLLRNGSNNEIGGGKKCALPLSSDDMICGKEVKKLQNKNGGEKKGTPPPPSDGKAAAMAAAKSWNPPLKYASTPTHSAKCNNNEGDGEKKRAHPPEHINSGRETKKHLKKADKFVIDLTDVPPQPPIPKSKGRIKEGASKFVGVSFHKPRNKWRVSIMFEGKQRYVGSYESEEEAAVNYARAVFKYHGQEALVKAREAIDLSVIPPQPPILKGKGCIKEGSSKYTGVSFDKTINKWQAKIKFEGKKRHIGLYENEKEAAIDYARALFKYKGQEALDKAREQKQPAPAIDLSDVPSQLPILRSEGSKGRTSKYVGVNFDKVVKKWKVVTSIDGTHRHIGYYEDEEEAAADYARAVFKYKGQDALHKMREREKSTLLSPNDNNNRNGGGKKRPLPLPSIDMISGRETTKKRQRADKFVIDLADVPPQLPILKNKGHYKEGTSKYTGVSFHKPRNKWRAAITINGKNRYVGSYESEEEAAVNYARAVFKYHGQEALVKAREAIDLSDVPPQPPIPKSGRYIKDCSSKYTGVSFDKSMNKWRAIIWIERTKRHIGYYDDEEEAAIDYARAVFKYK